MEIVLFSPSGICTSAQRTLTVINVYNPPRAAASTAPLFAPTDIFPLDTAATLVARDFNLHHYSADPTKSVSLKEYLASDPFFSTADQRGYTLLNTPRVYTRFP